MERPESAISFGSLHRICMLLLRCPTLLAYNEIGFVMKLVTHSLFFFCILDHLNPPPNPFYFNNLFITHSVTQFRFMLRSI